MTARVFVDTNVFVYNRDLSQKVKQQNAERWVSSLWQARSGRISMQVLQEFYVTVTEKLDPKIPKSSARDDVRDLMAWRPLHPDLKLLESAWSFQDRFKVSWWDSLIVAAAHSSKCQYILSEDLQDGQMFDEVRVISPFTYQPESILDLSQ
jgi:predicted nucleic acid-binding protein